MNGTDEMRTGISHLEVGRIKSPSKSRERVKSMIVNENNKLPTNPSTKDVDDSSVLKTTTDNVSKKIISDDFSINSKESIQNLKKQRILKNPLPTKLIAKISRFFKRMFKMFTTAEKNIYSEINKLIQEVESPFKKMTNHVNQLSRKNKVISNQYPTNSTIRENKEKLTAIQSSLNDVEGAFGKLTVEKKTQALELEDNHITLLKSSAEKIKDLELNINHTKSYIHLLEKIIGIEVEMDRLPSFEHRKDMKKFCLSKDNWNQFVIVRKSFEEMASTLEYICKNTPELKNDKFVQKILKKSPLSSKEVIILLNLKFPGLSTYYKRLNGLLELSENKKSQEITRYVAEKKKTYIKFKDTSKRLNNLYWIMHGEGFFAKIKRWKSDPVQVAAAIKKLNLYLKSLSEKMTDNEEYKEVLIWLKETGKNDLAKALTQSLDNIKEVDADYKMSLDLNRMLFFIQKYLREEEEVKECDLLAKPKYNKAQAFEKFIAKRIYKLVDNTDKNLSVDIIIQRFVKRVSDNYPLLKFQAHVISDLIKGNGLLKSKLKDVINKLISNPPKKTGAKIDNNDSQTSTVDKGQNPDNITKKTGERDDKIDQNDEEEGGIVVEEIEGEDKGQIKDETGGENEGANTGKNNKIDEGEKLKNSTKPDSSIPKAPTPKNPIPSPTKERSDAGLKKGDTQRKSKTDKGSAKPSGDGSFKFPAGRPPMPLSDIAKFDKGNLKKPSEVSRNVSKVLPAKRRDLRYFLENLSVAIHGNSDNEDDNEDDSEWKNEEDEGN